MKQPFNVETFLAPVHGDAAGRYRQRFGVLWRLGLPAAVLFIDEHRPEQEDRVLQFHAEASVRRLYAQAI